MATWYPPRLSRKDTKPSTFWGFCKEGDVEKVKEMLKYCSDLNTPKFDEKRTPLAIACREGHFEVVKELLKEKNLIVDLTDPLDCCVYDIQLNDKKLEIFRLILEDGRVKINKSDALRHICIEGNLDFFNLLLPHNPDLSTEKNNYALEIAAENGFFEIVKELVLCLNVVMLDSEYTKKLDNEKIRNLLNSWKPPGGKSYFENKYLTLRSRIDFEQLKTDLIERIDFLLNSNDLMYIGMEKQPQICIRLESKEIERIPVIFLL